MRLKPFSPAPTPLPRLRPVCAIVRAAGLALASGALWHAPAAWAQSTGASPTDGLTLQISPRLAERLPGNPPPPSPTHVYGDVISGQPDINTVVEGHAELRRHDMVLRADRLEHTNADDTAHATGHVRINRLGNVYEGPELKLKLDTYQGYFLSPEFSLLENGGNGVAERMDFIDHDHATAHKVIYSTCEKPKGSKWMPDWWVSASQIDFDMAEETGAATSGVLHFKGLPVLAAPYITFPLSDKRKSGMLPPTINLDNRSGLEVTLPYYLNLAPEMDATLYPTIMSKRGIDLGGEFRYLDRSFKTTLMANYMPSDKLRDSDRWSTSIQHNQTIADVPGLGAMGLRLNLNRVSDDNYWRDFPRAGKVLTQRLLPSEAVMYWNRGDWSVSAGSYTWQTLQDPKAPIIAPYDREPSLAARYAPASFTLGGLDGVDFTLSTELTRFTTDRALVIGNGTTTTSVMDGTRAVAVAQLSKTWQTPGWFVKPGIQLHARQYQFDQALANGQSSQGIIAPTVSLDSGMFFERDTQYFGRDFVQTLEPRLYYVNTPYRDQRYLPAYDTALFDFNMATIFTPNPYAGNDRIADLNAVTVGATSRLLNPETGEEILSLGVAQRYRFADQQVVLPGESPATAGVSDLLVGGRLNWSPQWSFNGTVQYNLDRNVSPRTTLGMRYNPSNYRVFNAAYRLKNGPTESKQIDLGWQWPLNDLFGSAAPDRGPGRGLGSQQWYSVGRINYSMTDGKIVDLLAGFEYDAGCWIGRVVVERLQSSTTSANRRILFQLEFSGFSRIGSSPLQTLKNNIPRYQYLREEINPPSRFERYE